MPSVVLEGVTLVEILVGCLELLTRVAQAMPQLTTEPDSQDYEFRAYT